MIGAPLHPDWDCLVRPPSDGLRPRVMTYVHRRLASLRPAYRRDLADSRDIMILSLFQGSEVINLANIYNDDRCSALHLLCDAADTLPAFSLMTGDFNLHSEVWNPDVPHHRTDPQSLVDLAQDLGMEWCPFTIPGPTHIPHDEMLRPSVIDLVFTPPQEDALCLP